MPAADGHSGRACFEGVLWVLRAGPRWTDLPDRFSSYPTFWRKFVELIESCVLENAWRRLIGKLDRAGQVD
ncbi:transposase [Posidoniimonas corsicana]|uniref:transposase n=1 Tax=Posidoniimonas corsicana TaxID=1938618 RepID=UPI0011B656D6|nr:transposase [Posidoniimonas corsicana]